MKTWYFSVPSVPYYSKLFWFGIDFFCRVFFVILIYRFFWSLEKKNMMRWDGDRSTAELFNGGRQFCKPWDGKYGYCFATINLNGECLFCWCQYNNWRVLFDPGAERLTTAQEPLDRWRFRLFYRKHHKLRKFVNFSFNTITMSGLGQEQYNITISVLVNGASINAVALYFYVHCNSISRLQTCFRYFVTVCDRQKVTNHVSQLQNNVLSIQCTLRNRFRNAALASRNIPSKRRTAGQTIRNRLREINPRPIVLQ